MRIWLCRACVVASDVHSLTVESGPVGSALGDVGLPPLMDNLGQRGAFQTANSR